MSLFNAKPGTERPITRPEGAPADGGLSVIASGMKVVGDIESTGVVKVDGTVEGAVRGVRQLLLGRTGFIQGDIYAEEVVLGGKVIGNVIAAERVEVQGTSTLQGDIHTKSIVVLEGGVINGVVRMDEAARAAAGQTQRANLALTQ